MRSHRFYTPWLLMLPALVWLALFSVWPAINTVTLSFTNVHQLTGGHFIGLKNYWLLWHDPHIRDAVINTIVFMAICVPLLTFLPLLLALLVQRNVRGIAFFRTAFYFPVIASAVTVALIWKWMLDDRGLFNNLLQTMGVVHKTVPFLTDRWLLLLSAIALTVWKGLGYYMILYMSALGSVRRELHEAAAVDGAGAWHMFRYLTMPHMRQYLELAGLLGSIYIIQNFDAVFTLTPLNPQTQNLPYLIYRTIQSDSDYGLASAQGVIVVIFTIVIATFALRTVSSLFRQENAR